MMTTAPTPFIRRLHAHLSGEPTADTNPAPKSRRLTDYGNAERLIDQHGRDLRYCHEWKSWLVWDGKRWRRDATAEVVRRAKRTIRAMYREAEEIENEEDRAALVKHAQRSEAKNRIDAMIALAASEPGVSVELTELDRDPWLLNCNNGTLNLRGGYLQPHRQEDLITRLVPVDYDPDATCPLW